MQVFPLGFRSPLQWPPRGSMQCSPFNSRSLGHWGPFEVIQRPSLLTFWPVSHLGGVLLIHWPSWKVASPLQYGVPRTQVVPSKVVYWGQHLVPPETGSRDGIISPRLSLLRRGEPFKFCCKAPLARWATNERPNANRSDPILAVIEEKEFIQNTSVWSVKAWELSSFRCSVLYPVSLSGSHRICPHIPFWVYLADMIFSAFLIFYAKLHHFRTVNQIMRLIEFCPSSMGLIKMRDARWLMDRFSVLMAMSSRSTVGWVKSNIPPIRSP